MLHPTQRAEERQTCAVTHTTDHFTNLAQNQHCKLTHVLIRWGRELSHISHPISAGINGLVECATPALQQLFVLVLQERRGGAGEGRRGKVSDQTCLNLTHQLIHPRRVCLCAKYEFIYCACLQPEYKGVGRFTIKGTLPSVLCHWTFVAELVRAPVCQSAFRRYVHVRVPSRLLFFLAPRSLYM